MKILLIASLFLGLTSFAEEQTFTGEAAKIKSNLESLFEISKKVNAGGAVEKKARADMEKAIDWNELAEGCLGKENKKKYSSQFGQFRDLLKDVVIRTSYSRMDKFWEGNTTYKFEKIDVTGNKAVASAKFLVKEDSFALDYYLSKIGGDWKVTDISYEDLRYGTNINEQIDAFLKEKKSFPELLNKLKKRRAELKA